MKALFFSLALLLGLLTPAFAQEVKESISIAAVKNETYVVHGNYQSKIYHNQYCRYFNCKACTMIFHSPAEAIAKGYRACQVCGG